MGGRCTLISYCHVRTVRLFNVLIRGNNLDIETAWSLSSSGVACHHCRCHFRTAKPPLQRADLFCLSDCICGVLNSAILTAGMFVPSGTPTNARIMKDLNLGQTTI